MIDARICDGMKLQTFGFGTVYVRKLYTHKETGELCLDCKAENGETLHLSQAYAVKLMGPAR